MTDLAMHPEPPEAPPGPGVVVLGRFQPLHRGHALMIAAAEQWRASNTPESPLIIAIGSSNRPESMENPWTVEERISMLEAWLGPNGIVLGPFCGRFGTAWGSFWDSVGIILG